MPYDTFFAIVGVKFIPKREVTGFTLGGIGIRPNEEGKAAVASVAKMNEFGKKMGYQQGDILISINGEEVSAINYPDVSAKTIANAKEGDTLAVKV